jgi:phenylalanine N-monooxygenase
MFVEELDRVVGKQQLVQESDSALLNYVEVCAREAFRLHPVAPLNIPRVSMADTVVSNHFIPRGSYAILSRLGTLKFGTSHWDSNQSVISPEQGMLCWLRMDL